MTNTLTTPLPSEPEALAETTDIADIIAEYVEYSPVGLTIKGEMPFEKWEKGVPFHMALRTRTQWMIGDYIRYGEKYGEKYAQAVDIGKSESRLQTYVSVCGRFSIERRREALSFDCHAECAYIDPREADLLLVRAQREGWSAKDIREEVAKINERNGTGRKRKSKTAAQIAASGKTPSEGQLSLPSKEYVWNGYAVTTKDGALYTGSEKIPEPEDARCAKQFGFSTVAEMASKLEATAPAPEAPPKPADAPQAPTQPEAAPSPAATVQTPAAQIEPDQNVALERAEVALNRFVESIPAVDWASMGKLARKKWLARLIDVDNLIDVLQAGL